MWNSAITIDRVSLQAIPVEDAVVQNAVGRILCALAVGRYLVAHSEDNAHAVLLLRLGKYRNGRLCA